MRIDPKNNIEGVYETNLKKNQSITENSVNKDTESNVDRVEISKNAANYDEINSLKESVVRDVEKGADPDRLRSLKAQIENGTYYVSSQDIAGKIISSVASGGKDTENE